MIRLAKTCVMALLAFVCLSAMASAANNAAAIPSFKNRAFLGTVPAAAAPNFPVVQIPGVGYFDWKAACPGTATTNGPYIAAAGGGAGCWTQESFPYGLQPTGQIYNVGTFNGGPGWSSLSGLVTVGFTPTVSGGNLLFSGGAGNFNQSLEQTAYTELPQWTQTVTITVGTVTVSSNGIGLGTDSYTAANFLPIIGRVDLSSTGNGGKVDIWQTIGGGVLATSPTALTFVAGDVVQLTVTLNNNIFTVSASDLTTKSAPVTASYQFSFNLSSVGALSPNRGRFAIYNVGGNQTITSWTIASDVPQNVDAMCVGDSKTVGYYADAYASAWCVQLQQYFRTSDESGGGDGTVDALAIVPEIISLHPKTVILNIGRNDIGTLPIGTIEANYTSIVNQLTAAGIQVYNLLPIYETVANQAALSAYISGTYPTTSIDSGCQNYSGTASTVLASDNIHPNAFCHGLIAQAVLAFYRTQPQNTLAPGYFSFSQNFGQGAPVRTGGAAFAPPGGSSLPGYFFFGAPVAKTNTAVTYLGNLAQTNETANPFALTETVQGSATTGLRTVSLQTHNVGVDNLGTLSLQPLGGTVILGSATPTQVVVLSALDVGNVTIASAVQSYAFTCTSAQATVGNTRCGALGSSSDASNPFILGVTMTGSATPTSRIFQLQTAQDQSVNQGNLDIQGSGGSIGLGITTVPSTGLEVGLATKFDSTIAASGGAGVTCAPGSPTASFATSNGIVIHC